MTEGRKSRSTNTSRSADSNMDETITITVMAVAKGLGVLVWWSVLFPMISIPTVICLWLGFRYGAIFGVLFVDISPSFGGVVSNLARVVPRVCYGADAVQVAKLVDLSPLLDRDLHPARPHRHTGRCVLS